MGVLSQHRAQNALFMKRKIGKYTNWPKQPHSRAPLQTAAQDQNGNIPWTATETHSSQLLFCLLCGHGWLSAGLASIAPCIWNRTWAHIPCGSSLPLSPHHHSPTSLLKQAAPSAGGQIFQAPGVGGWGQQKGKCWLLHVRDLRSALTWKDIFRLNSCAFQPYTGLVWAFPQPHVETACRNVLVVSTTTQNMWSIDAKWPLLLFWLVFSAHLSLNKSHPSTLGGTWKLRRHTHASLTTSYSRVHMLTTLRRRTSAIWAQTDEATVIIIQ